MAERNSNYENMRNIVSDRSQSIQKLSLPVLTWSEFGNKNQNTNLMIFFSEQTLSTGDSKVISFGT